jgi:hypothetical protein
MTRVVGSTKIENDDLTCPITLELFRDPVIAKDGRTYERVAITRWILEHGTSPFTREPLNVNDLRSDDRLRRLVVQRRNSTVSYNVQNNSVTLPPLRRVPRNNTRVAPEVAGNRIRVNYPIAKCSPLMICFFIIALLICMGVTLGIVFGMTYSNSYSNTNSSGTVDFFNCNQHYTLKKTIQLLTLTVLLET